MRMATTTTMVASVRCDFSDYLCVDGVCAASCSFDSECTSECCVHLKGGGEACFPGESCE